MKKIFFLLCVAIATVTALTSCDKDKYLESENHACFFKIIDDSHINVYDQYGILIEENKDTEFKIFPQYDKVIYGNSHLEPAQDETLSHRLIINDGIVKDNYVESFYYNHFANHIRIEGLFIETTDALGQKFDLACLSPLLVTASLVVKEQKEDPFYQRIEIVYNLLAGDTLVVATATQKVFISNNEDFVIKNL